jgi:hypothetical protein
VKSEVRSTKELTPEHPKVEAAATTLAELRQKHRDVYLKAEEASEMVYSDQTGRFAVTSSGGHKYIMVLIEIDSNYISMEPMKSRETGETIQAYTAIMQRLKNKCISLKKQMKRKWIGMGAHPTTQSSPKRAIQTAKGHIIAIGCDPTFPLKEWHRIMPQIESTRLQQNATRTIRLCNTMLCSRHTKINIWSTFYGFVVHWYLG